ncbi:AbrB/MazE/SpoVT family DNA-binding domain-containing protein [Halobellus sp. Atlit-31R]|nr:AbrB/MazE/SpoVT family DNA-binding domain-containing protein [Halobellus sp. Atlit-31R]
MSTQQERSSESRGDQDVGVSIVQESSGSLRVTIPANIAEQVTIEKGSSVFVISDSDSEIRVRETSTVDL